MYGTYEKDAMRELIGRRVARLVVGEGEAALMVETDGGPFTYTTSADCCSETWFADIVGVSNLLGEVVTAVETLDLPQPEEDDGRSRQESDAFYGIRLKTAKGDVDIIYRNSSNGYYGGDIESCAQERIDGREINQDWRAESPVEPND